MTCLLQMDGAAFAEGSPFSSDDIYIWIPSAAAACHPPPPVTWGV